MDVIGCGVRDECWISVYFDCCWLCGSREGIRKVSFGEKGL